METESGGNIGVPSESIIPETAPRKPSVLLLLLCITAASFTVFFYHLAGSPMRETKNVIIEINEGGSVQSVARTLFEEHIIRSPGLFSVLTRVYGIETALPSGTFQFHMPMNVFGVLSQLAARDHGIAQAKITIPEGLTNKQIAFIVGEQLPLVTTENFLQSAEGKEGYLFPDTYFFYVTATSGPVIRTMNENFEVRTEDLAKEAAAQGKPWKDILVMASILEEEAATDTDRALISGILWKRITLGMRLQVDASFSYLMEKESAEITLDDLDHDSPYNTYRYGGLPPGAIGNPGLAALSAALHPAQSDYLYYLSDKEGVMHYARTFEEHKLNKAKYLR